MGNKISVFIGIALTLYLNLKSKILELIRKPDESKFENVMPLVDKKIGKALGFNYFRDSHNRRY